MDIEVGIDFGLQKFKENLLSLLDILPQLKQVGFLDTNA